MNLKMVATLLLLSLCGCDQLELSIMDAVLPSHYVCGDSPYYRFSFVLSQNYGSDEIKSLLLNGSPQAYVNQSEIEIYLSLTAADLFSDYGLVDKPEDPETEAQLSVNLVTGRFKVWVFGGTTNEDGMKLGTNFYGSCVDIKPVFDSLN